jgi:acetyl esterase/lipase
MAIERKFRKPDAIILAYPGNNKTFNNPFLALNMSKFEFVPSMLLSVDDPILPQPFLRMCLKSYSGCTSFDHDDLELTTSPYQSPLSAPDEILKQFPTTKIMVPSNDPLRDDSFKFTLKLL